MNTTAQVETSKYVVELVSTEAGFDGLEQTWREVLEDGGFSVFQSFEWQRTWWKHYGEKNPWMRLCILVVREEDAVVAIAPCCIETLTTLGVLHVRCLSFLGRGKSDYLDAIAKKGMENDSAETFARTLWGMRGTFDMLFIEDMSDRSPNGMPLYEALLRYGFTGNRFISEYCPRTSFAPTWPETSASLPCNSNGRMDKRRRQLATRHKAESEFSEAGSLHDGDIDEFIALHQHRWQAAGQSGLFADRQFSGFFREALDRLRGRGWPVFAFLRLEGKRVVGICGFQYRGEFHYYLNGLGDTGTAKQFSPGIVLHLLCMERMFERGVRTYDFLRGVERYKYELGAVDVPNWTLLMYSHPGTLVKKKHRMYLLQLAFVRRLRQEWSMIRHKQEEHGIFSGAMARYTMKRVGMVVRDGYAKFRVPEQSVLTTENQR